MTTKLQAFKTFSWVLALGVAGFFLLLIFAMFALSAGPWTTGDYVGIILFGGTYIIGLVSGRFRPLIGGLLSLLLPLFIIVTMVYSLIIHPVEGGGFLIGSLLMYALLMVPGILYLRIWMLERRARKRADIS
jgi:hypothetical protein